MLQNKSVLHSVIKLYVSAAASVKAMRGDRFVLNQFLIEATCVSNFMSNFYFGVLFFDLNKEFFMNL